ncbi:MAG TPA: DUF3147 family protein [candidate division Zixibacteria bacterium]|nr:DUF3147 family protein [candidate division Zixibacteria bacterium]
MTELLIRFVIGGIVVSCFALIADLFKPESFGGLFGAAPSVAIATLSIAYLKKGAEYVSTESRSMILGAIALGVYAQFVCWLLMRRRMKALPATLVSMPAWFAVAGGLFLLLR